MQSYRCSADVFIEQTRQSFAQPRPDITVEGAGLGRRTLRRRRACSHRNHFVLDRGSRMFAAVPTARSCGCPPLPFDFGMIGLHSPTPQHVRAKPRMVHLKQLTPVSLLPMCLQMQLKDVGFQKFCVIGPMFMNAQSARSCRALGVEKTRRNPRVCICCSHP